jgi:Ca2+/H+ antiporter
MNYVVPAQLAAQLLSLFVFGTMAIWYAAPRLNARDRVDALVPLLWVHVFRYLALQAFRAQQDGFPISDAHLMGIVLGDLAGMAIALAALYALRFRAGVGIWLAWLLVGEFVYDTVANIQAGAQEHLFGQSRGVSWLVVGVYVPLLIVTTVLLAWQLYTRRNETLSASAETRAHAAPASRLGAHGQA